jgi:hypothetical protein
LKLGLLERPLKDATEKLVEVLKVKKVEPDQSVKMVNEVWTVDQAKKDHQEPPDFQAARVH